MPLLLTVAVHPLLAPTMVALLPEESVVLSLAWSAA